MQYRRHNVFSRNVSEVAHGTAITGGMRTRLRLPACLDDVVVRAETPGRRAKVPVERNREAVAVSASRWLPVARASTSSRSLARSVCYDAIMHRPTNGRP